MERYLHGQEAEALSVQQQTEHNECQADIRAQDAQGCDADKVTKEGLLSHCQASAENDGRQEEPAACHALCHFINPMTTVVQVLWIASLLISHKCIR